jgi:hypothetical protein
MEGLQGIDAYLNPYISQVADQTLAGLDRFRQMATNQNASNATMSNAFGGDRHAVTDALTNEAFGREAASALADLYKGGFDSASGLLMGDKSNLIQNQQFNAGLQQEMNLANLGYKNQAASQNAELKQRTAAANQKAEIEAANTNLGGAQSLAGIGAQQYQAQVDALNAQYQEFLRSQNYDAATQDLLNKTFGMVGNSMNGQYTPPQNIFGGSAGQMAGSAAGAFGALMASDGRLKTDMQTVGYDHKGRRWIDFRYKWEEPGTVHRGVIAQEILHSDPDAVLVDQDGVLYVDYSKLH